MRGEPAAPPNFSDIRGRPPKRRPAPRPPRQPHRRPAWTEADHRPLTDRAEQSLSFGARFDLVLRLRREIAGVMALAQLSFRRPAGAIDHSPALDGRALADFLRPARQVLVVARLQELAR